MDLKSILMKTEKGEEEIATRKYKLDHRMRALLLVVNGKRTADELAGEFARFGDVAAMLDRLLRDGFVRTDAMVGDVRREIVFAINDTLGPDGSAIAEEVENCRSLPDLRRYVSERRELFEATLGRQKAVQIWSKLNG